MELEWSSKDLQLAQSQTLSEAGGIKHGGKSQDVESNSLFCRGTKQKEYKITAQ